MPLVELEFNKPFIAELILNRADKLNAFSQQMMVDFMAVLKTLAVSVQNDQTRVVVIRSSASPKAFCAGADLNERMKMSASEVSETLKTQSALMNAVAGLPVPVIVAISGVAFGGGLELALCGDYRVSSQPSMMGLTETKLAIIPGAGGTQRLRWIVGEAKAKELIYFGKRLSGEEALKIGLVNELDSDPNAVALARATELLESGPVALRAAKKSIEGYRAKTALQDLQIERDCYEMVLHTQDRIEGLKAFSEKRKPLYQGK